MKKPNSALKASVLDIHICQKVKAILLDELYSNVWESVAEDCYVARSQKGLSKSTFVGLCEGIKLDLESVENGDKLNPLDWWKCKVYMHYYFLASK